MIVPEEVPKLSEKLEFDTFNIEFSLIYTIDFDPRKF